METEIEKLYSIADAYAHFLTIVSQGVGRESLRHVGHDREDLFPPSGDLGLFINYERGSEKDLTYDYTISFSKGVTRVVVTYTDYRFRMSLPREINAAQIQQLVEDLEAYLPKLQKHITEKVIVEERLRALEKAKTQIREIEIYLKAVGYEIS